MSVGLKHPKPLTKIKGIRLSACSAGIYCKKRDDMALMEIVEGSIISAAFTKNYFCAAPIKVSKDNLIKEKPRYCLINAGNANAGTGETGLSNAKATCKELSRITNCSEYEVLPFSTGVIGENLPVEKICKVLPRLVKDLSDNSWLDVAKSIMTTDTIPKAFSTQVNLNGSMASVTGIAKGSGMIKPNMATMLAFIATDANVTKDTLDKIKANVLSKSFNRITVDGDTSTNDSFILISTCQLGNKVIDQQNSSEYKALENKIEKICCELAQAIVRDGEGATKFISIKVNEGNSNAECLSVAYKIAESPLVKTAFTASDPNWGRILAAIGNSNIDNLDVSKVDIFINDLCILCNGERSHSYNENDAKMLMMQDEISLLINLGRGSYAEEIWTTDLSNEYIKINAEYRN